MKTSAIVTALGLAALAGCQVSGDAEVDTTHRSPAAANAQPLPTPSPSTRPVPPQAQGNYEDLEFIPPKMAAPPGPIGGTSGNIPPDPAEDDGFTPQTGEPPKHRTGGGSRLDGSGDDQTPAR